MFGEALKKNPHLMAEEVKSLAPGHRAGDLGCKNVEPGSQNPELTCGEAHCAPLSMHPCSLLPDRHGQAPRCWPAPKSLGGGRGCLAPQVREASGRRHGREGTSTTKRNNRATVSLQNTRTMNSVSRVLFLSYTFTFVLHNLFSITSIAFQKTTTESFVERI